MYDDYLEFEDSGDYPQSFWEIGPIDRTFECPRCGAKIAVGMGIEDEFGGEYCVGCASTFHKPQFGMNPNDDGYDFDDEPGAF